MLPTPLDRAFQEAFEHHTAGRLAQAELGYREVLARQPDHFSAICHLGILAMQTGNSDSALALFHEASRLNSNIPELYLKMAGAYIIKRDAHGAITACEAALRLRPQYPEALNHLGIALHLTGNNKAAVAACGEALRLRPAYPEAWINLGLAYQTEGDFEKACTSYIRATQLDPNLALAHYDLGHCLKMMGRLEAALNSYRTAQQLAPENPDICNNLGAVLQTLHQRDEAIAYFQQALNVNPEHVGALHNLCSALQSAGRIDAAHDVCQKILCLQPESAEAHAALGNCRRDLAQHALALDAYRWAVRLKPDDARLHSSLVYCLYYTPGEGPDSIATELQRWNQQHAVPLRIAANEGLGDRTPNRPLRIGYVSPDFRDHVVGRNILPLFREHDKTRFQIFCYSDVSCPDALTVQFRSLAHGWRDTLAWNDEQLAAQIRADRVDILVDLTLHMGGNRLLVFARKPAPIQVTFAGYPASTGLSAMDYRLTDQWLEPAGDLEDNDLSGEFPLRLPRSFWCYDPDTALRGLAAPLEISALPAEVNGYVTFGFLGAFCKVNDEILRLWAKILGAVDRSRLLLLAPEGTARQWVQDIFRAEGIDPPRVQFVSIAPREEYLLYYHRLDVGLDPVPYNGHTTTLDALWMGVPVITLRGNTSVGRAGDSILSSLGLAEFVADTPGHYLTMAIALSGNRARLHELRLTLRERMRGSALCDARDFAASIESAYRRMRQTTVEGTSRLSFSG